PIPGALADGERVPGRLGGRLRGQRDVISHHQIGGDFDPQRLAGPAHKSHTAADVGDARDRAEVNRLHLGNPKRLIDALPKLQIAALTYIQELHLRWHALSTALPAPAKLVD